MTKTEQGIEILKALGLPKEQQNERSARTLLTLLALKENDPWPAAKRSCIRIHDIIAFIEASYGRKYAENSRETIRRQTLHQFVQAGIVERNPDNPSRPTNSPDTVYAITDEAHEVIKKFGTEEWPRALESFIKQKGKLVEKYDKKRMRNKIDLKLPTGLILALSSGKHNEIQVEVIKELLPRFFQKAQVIYLGDTAHKLLTVNEKLAQKLNIPITQHDKLPDIVLYEPSKDVLVLIEVVTSHGPVTPKRQIELEDVLKDCKVKKIYVSAFPDFRELRKHLSDIAWETEIWLADKPEHMIHFNGPKFLNVE